MEVTRYRICNGADCDEYITIAGRIENVLGLENVVIDPETAELRYDNPKRCHVDRRLLEEAARYPEKHIEFEVCE